MQRMPRRALISSSYPRLEDESAGHFVAAEAELGNLDGLVICAPSPAPPPGLQAVEHIDLGGSSLFGSPGMIANLKRRPWSLLGLASASLRLLVSKVGWRPWRRLHELELHWLLPGLFPLSLAAARADSTTIWVHGSDVRLLARLPAALVWLFLSLSSRRNMRLHFVSQELKREFASLALPGSYRRALASASIRPAHFLLPPAAQDEEQARASFEAYLRERHALLLERPSALVVGRLLASKRVGVALSALTLLDSLQIFVIGTGPEEEALRRAYPQAHFLGQLSRTLTLQAMRCADLVVSASQLEGAPTALREALALGTPVVSTEVGDLASYGDEQLHLVG